MTVNKVMILRAFANISLVIYTFIIENLTNLIEFKNITQAVSFVMFCMVVPIYVYLLISARKTSDNTISFLYVFYILSLFFYFGQYILIVCGYTERLQSEYISLLCGKLDDNNVISGMFILSRSLLILNLGYIIIAMRKKRTYTNRPQVLEFDRGFISVAKILFVLSSIGTIISLTYDISVGSYELRRANESSVYSFSSGNPLFYAKYISQWFLPSLYMLMIFTINTSKKRYKVLLFILGIYSVLYLISGSRYELIKISCAVFLIHSTFVERIKPRKFLKFIPFAILAGLVLSSVSNLRNTGFSFDSLFNSITSTNPSDFFYGILKETGVTACSLDNTLQHCPSDVAHPYFMSIIKMICSVLPSFINPLYQEVTTSVSNIFSPYMYGTVKSGYGSSFITEAYYYWGSFMYIVIFLYGLIIARMKNVIDNIIHGKNTYAIFASIFMYSEIIYCIRSDVISLFRSFVYCVVFPYFLMKLFKTRKKLEYN